MGWMKETVMTAAPPAIATCVKSPGVAGDAARGAAKGDCVFKLMVIRGIEVKGVESVLAVWKIVMGDQSISSVSDDVLRVRGSSRIFRSFAGTAGRRRCFTRY
jgi:hypothetical protein